MKNEVLEILRDINPYVDIDVETNLFEEDVLDSMGLLVLITELEEKFSIKIPLDDLQLENFEYINNIIEFVKSMSDKNE